MASARQGCVYVVYVAVVVVVVLVVVAAVVVVVVVVWSKTSVTPSHRFRTCV